MANAREVYLYVYNEFLVTTQEVADALFDGDVAAADFVLSSIRDDHELIASYGDDSWQATPNYDHIDVEEAEANAKELSEGEASESAPEVTPEAPEPSESVTEASNPCEEVPALPLAYRNVERARENFTTMVENAPSDAARTFWQAKLDSLPAAE